MTKTAALLSRTGLISDAEADALSALAGLCNEDCSIVEIGSFTGKSTEALASRTAAQVYAVDLWDMRLPGEDLLKKGRKRAKKYGVDFNSSQAFELFRHRTASLSNVTSIKGDSAQIAKAWSRPLCLLFIDGAHDAASVRRDYEGWSPYIVSGGTIAFHDANKEDGKVRTYIEKEVKPSGLWEAWSLIDSLLTGRRK